MNIFLVQIIVFTFLGVSVFLLLRWISNSGEKMLIEKKRKIEIAPKANARIVAVGKSRSQKHNGTIMVKLRLEIFPLDMRPSFQTEAVWEVEPAMIYEIAPEKVLPVKFDEHDITRIYPLAP
jgi:hypothetical protein